MIDHVGDIALADMGHGSREWRVHVEAMITSAENVQEYTNGLNREAFVADGLTRDATLHSLVLISAAAARIPDAVRDALPNIPWGEILGFRNRLVQGYRDIDDATVWTSIEGTVAELLPALRTVLNATGKDR